MTTYTIFASDTNYGNVRSGSDANVVTVRAGTTFLNYNNGASVFAGFSKTGSPLYAAYENFFEFDTSGVVGTISSAVVSLWYSAVTGADTDLQVFQLRAYDFGASVTTASFRSSTVFAAETLVGHQRYGLITVGAYNALTSDTGMIASINQSGPSRYVLCTDMFAADGTPTVGALATLSSSATAGTVNDPKIVIVAIAPVLCSAALAEVADTFVATGLLIVGGTLLSTEGADILAATATNPDLGKVAVAEAADALVSAGTMLVVGAASITEAGDTFTSAGKVLVAGNAALAEASDTIAETGQVIIGAHVSITEADDMLVGAHGHQTIIGRGSAGARARARRYPGVFADFGPTPNPDAYAEPLEGASPEPLAGAMPEVNPDAMPKVNPKAWPRPDPRPRARAILAVEAVRKKRQQDDDEAAFLLL